MNVVQVVGAFFVSLALAKPAISSDCEYLFKLNDGERYSLSDISEFVASEIRPKLDDEGEMFQIYIDRRCADSERKVLSIGMLSRNYYLLEINGVELPPHVVRYNNRLAIDISKDDFTSYIDSALVEDFSQYESEDEVDTYIERKGLQRQQKILKMLAFVFAEAARFKSAEQALDKAVEGNCSIDWHDFDYAVHNWRNISDFLHDKRIRNEEQIAGGGKGQLLAPITVRQERLFEEALLNGEQYRHSYTAPFFEYEYECSG